MFDFTLTGCSPGRPNHLVKKFSCESCGRSYQSKGALTTHTKWECGKEPQFQCPHCIYKAKLKGSLKSHLVTKHVNLIVPP